MSVQTLTLGQLKNDWAAIQEDALNDYLTFLRFKSISTDLKYKEETIRCARWLQDYVKQIGFETELWETPGYPVIFASHNGAGPSKPTLLIYNHYDVQPADPLSEWDSPPFEPIMRDGEVFARGAQDNKGQCFYVLQALKALLKHNPAFPINIKLCIEGEEEIGSPQLAALLKEKDKQKKLKADYLAIVDTGLPDKETPAITLGVRGIVTMEVRVQGSSADLHSGSHGGLVYNPLHALVEMLAKLRDKEGKITIPGFYEDVLEMTQKEKSQIAFDFDEKKYEAMFGVKSHGGEKALAPLERAWNRPTLEINGIAGGYGGIGFKTVIPSKAIAKISCRLVPDQDPHKIGNLVAKYLKEIAPKEVAVEVEIFNGVGKAIRANPFSKVVKAFSMAYEELFQKPCKNIFEGASIPIVTELAEVSQSEVILLGFGLPDDQIHAPNEHFGVDRLEKGFLVLSLAIQNLGNLN
jgi:acetylornithine deacetylase/succinyl-diaminopimelate desuccinylase-like protein